MLNPYSLVKLPLTLMLVFWLAYQLLASGLSAFHLNKSYDGDGTQLEQSLSWDETNSRALYLKASRDGGADQKPEELLQAIWHNPADTRALALLADQIKEQSPEQADQLMDVADRLMPANKQVSLQAATHWLSRRDLPSAITAWGKALSIDPQLGPQLYPVFLQIASVPEGRALINAFIQNPPTWWDDYLQFVLKHDNDIELLLDMLRLHRMHQQPLSVATRESLVQKLIKAQLWEKAYLVWAEALDKQQRKYLASVFDGGFESDQNQTAFGWNIQKHKYIDVAIQRVYGADDSNALQIGFIGKEIPFRHVYQYLLLAPGSYHLEGKARTEILTGRGQLKWVVRCASQPDQLVGASQPVLISQDWQPFSFDFTVPDVPACKAQLLRLETFGKHAFDHKLTGSVWFDSFHIRQRY